MAKKERNGIWDLFEKTGLPEAYSMYREEERRKNGDGGKG